MLLKYYPAQIIAAKRVPKVHNFHRLLFSTGYFLKYIIKDEVEFWSCDCIVKETVWNWPEKVDHLAYKNLCVLQGSGIIKW